MAEKNMVLRRVRVENSWRIFDMHAHKYISPETAVSILLELVNGTNSHQVQKLYKLNRQEVETTVYKYTPRFGSRILKGKLSREQQRDLLDFFQVVEKLLLSGRDGGTRENTLIVFAQEDLQKLLNFHSFHVGGLFRFIARKCLLEWRDNQDQILGSQKGIEKSLFRLSEGEVVSLLEILEQFAKLLPVAFQDIVNSFER
jgi:inorganic triphosphatase YgiF